MNFKSLPNDKVECFALVKKAEVKTSTKGGKYLDIILSDKDGEINGKYWDYVDGTTPDFPQNSVVKVRGTLNDFKGTTQLRIELIRAIVPTDCIDVEDLVRTAEYRCEDMFAEICTMFCIFKDEDLKNICLKVYEDNRKKLLYFPAAVKLHHAMRGGLLYHTLSIMKTADAVCSVYPLVDRDLLLAGASLHDIGKTVEMDANSLGLASEYTVDGNLIGHLVRGAMMVRKCGEEIGTPDEKIRLLEHMLLSHHGSPEFGSAVRPMFTEAMILSALDELDAKIYEFSEITGEIDAGTFSGRQWALDDIKVYNHGRTEIKPKAELLSEDADE